MTTPKLIGIMGGTFDPIHIGHLRIALEVLETLSLDHIRFIPCKQPVHKNHARASTQDRLNMLEIALKNQEKFILDLREIERETPSYMVPTLESLQKDFPDAHLCLILGADAAAGLPSWYKTERLPQLCHFIFVDRYLNPQLESDTQQRFGASSDRARLVSHRAGAKIHVATTRLDISSSMIRDRVAQGLRIDYLVTADVKELILSNQLYQLS